MDVTLTPELEAWIQDRVRAGHYATPGDLMLEALLRLKDRDAFREMKLAALRQELEVARIASEEGRVAPLDVDEIIRRGRQRRASARQGAAE